MVMDAPTQAFLELTATHPIDLSGLDAATARAVLDPASAAMEHPPEAVARVEDRTIPIPGAGDLPVRVYHPKPSRGPLPMLVYYHGGGFVLGNLDTHDSVCRTLANTSGCVTLSVGYRLAPEAPFPAAVDGAYRAVGWAAENARTLGGDPARIAVGGDSAGGTLAAVVCHLARDRGGPPIAFQLLAYPATDALREKVQYPSFLEFSEGCFLTGELMAWFAARYPGVSVDPSDFRLSPLRASHHRGLPPALVLTAGHDPLRDEGKRYADTLGQAGVPVVYRCFESTIHGFLSMGRFLPAALEGLSLCGNQIGSFLTRRGVA